MGCVKFDFPCTVVSPTTLVFPFTVMLAPLRPSLLLPSTVVVGDFTSIWLFPPRAILLAVTSTLDFPSSAIFGLFMLVLPGINFAVVPPDLSSTWDFPRHVILGDFAVKLELAWVNHVDLDFVVIF